MGALVSAVGEVWVGCGVMESRETCGALSSLLGLGGKNLDFKFREWRG